MSHLLYTSFLCLTCGALFYYCCPFLEFGYEELGNNSGRNDKSHLLWGKNALNLVVEWVFSRV